ncbi:MAG: hypothetical protein AAFZ07_13590 [Actinomycetota bacterium]
MSDAEHDVELLLDRVTPDAVPSIELPILRGRAMRRRRRRRLLQAGALGGVLVLAGVGLAVVAGDDADEVGVVDDDGPATTFGLPSITEELGLDLSTGFEHVYPPELVGDGQVDPYPDSRAVIADFARWVLRWSEAVEIEVADDERAEVSDPSTGRSVIVELGRDADGGWVVVRAGGPLAIDPGSGAPVVARPGGTVAVLVASAEAGGFGGTGTGFDTTPGEPLVVERAGPVDDAAIVVAASYDADGRVIEIATARDEDLEPPPLRYPLLVLDSMQVSGASLAPQLESGEGDRIVVGTFTDDATFDEPVVLFVSATPPWPGQVAGELQPSTMTVAGYEADVVVDDLSGTRFLQTAVDELFVLIEDRPSTETILESLEVAAGATDATALRILPGGPDQIRTVDRSVYGAEQGVVLVSGRGVGGRSFSVIADRGPYLGLDGRFRRLDRGGALGDGWVGDLPETEASAASIVVAWEATWGTWLTLSATGYSESEVLELAGAIELVDRSEWEAVYGP